MRCELSPDSCPYPLCTADGFWGAFFVLFFFCFSLSLVGDDVFDTCEKSVTYYLIHVSRC